MELPTFVAYDSMNLDNWIAKDSLPLHYSYSSQIC